MSKFKSIMINLDRASQDYSIWVQILKEQKVLCIPKGVNKFGKAYWTTLCLRYKGYKPKFKETTEELQPYTLNKGSCLMMSGGLESSLIHSMWPFVDTIDVMKQTVFSWTDPVEPLLAILGAAYGYHTTYIGSELILKKFNHVSKEDNIELKRQESWFKYSGAHAVSPWLFLRKEELYKIARREKVDFYSCFSNNTEGLWCGKCYKCAIIHTYDMKYLGKSDIVLKEDIKKIIRRASSAERIEYYNTIK